MGRYSGKTCRLSTMLLLTASFFLVEIIVGYVTNSIALVADSFHMLSDVVALIVGFASVRISKWPSKRNTYGWVRAEILGALVNAVFLLALCFSILVEALKRLVEVEKVDNPKLLLVVGGVGLLINLVGLGLFGGHGHSHGGGGHGHSHGGGGHGHSHGGGGDKGHGHSHETGGHGHSHNHDKNQHMSNGAGSPTENERLVSRQGSSSQTDVPTTEMTNGHVSVNSPKEKVIIVESEHDEIYISPSGSNVAMDIKKPQLASSNQLNMRGVFLHVLGDALGSVVVVVSALVIMFAHGDWKYYLDPAMSIVMVIIILSTTIPLLKESAFILLQTVPSHVNVENIIKELEQMEGIYGVHECHIWQLAGNRIVASAHIRCHGIEEYMDLASRIKQLFHKAGIHSTTIQPEFIDWQEAESLHQPCALMCESGGQLCTPHTCCGDKEFALRVKTTPSKGDDPGSPTDKEGHRPILISEPGASANSNNSALVSGSGNRNNSAGLSFQSAHSVDVKFSPDGDEIVLEMNEIHSDTSMLSGRPRI